MSDIFEQLASPFDPSEVDWRVGSTSKKDPNNPKGMALAYIDARTVMDRLDTVCGPAGWQCRYVMEGSKTVCEIGIKSAREHVANCKAKRLLKKHSSPTPEGSIKSRGFQGSRKFNGKINWRDSK